jgi:hypothetical protein
MANRQIEEEAEEAGITSESTLDQLKAEAAEIFKDFDTTAFRPNVAEGGLMRTNLAMGSKSSCLRLICFQKPNRTILCH